MGSLWYMTIGFFAVGKLKQTFFSDGEVSHDEVSNGKKSAYGGVCMYSLRNNQYHIFFGKICNYEVYFYYEYIYDI